MNNKKKILFVNESLALAGGEKSLIALLSNLDSELYEIDLQLFQYGRELDVLIPECVNILPAIPYTLFANKSWKKNIWTIFSKKNFSYFKARLGFSLAIRQGEFNTSEIAERYWKHISSVIPNNEKEYDVVIAYAHNIPTFYVNEKTKAKKKVAWVNVGLNFKEQNKNFQFEHYNSFDVIVPVSDVTNDHLKQLFPSLESKFYTIYDMIDYQSISKMANLHPVSFEENTFNILTVARLNLSQKGYDITLEACKILRDKGIQFHWYAIGEGSYRQEMETYIRENNLGNYFTFLGTTANPYPYFKAADLYVQTSRHEGFGLSIAEARLLNTPVVTTRFDTVYMQMVDGKNGLVTDMNAEAVAEAIIRMMNDQELYDRIVTYLKNEKKENTETVKKFDAMIEELLKNKEEA